MKILMHEVCPFRIGQRVTVSPANRFANEWPGNYAVVGIAWDYQSGDGTGINISIAADEDIEARYGSTDGWSCDDLLPATSPVSRPHRVGEA